MKTSSKGKEKKGIYRVYNKYVFNSEILNITYVLNQKQEKDEYSQPLLSNAVLEILANEIRNRKNQLISEK